MKLTKKEVVTIEVLRQTGETNQDIAARLGITEGAVRYHLKRQADKARDGRTKPSLIEERHLVEVVDQWYADQLASLPQGRPPNLHVLWSYLVDNEQRDHELAGGVSWRRSAGGSDSGPSVAQCDGAEHPRA